MIWRCDLKAMAISIKRYVMFYQEFSAFRIDRSTNINKQEITSLNIVTEIESHWQCEFAEEIVGAVKSTGGSLRRDIIFEESTYQQWERMRVGKEEQYCALQGGQEAMIIIILLD